MLAFRFQLTPAQVDLLLVLYAGRYQSAESLYLPDFHSNFFVTIFRRLEALGLATHDITRTPTYAITDKGIGIASLIVDDAKRIAAIKPGTFKESRKAARSK